VTPRQREKTVNEEERYLFDLMGYLVVDDVLDAAELRELNELIDRRDPWGAHAREGKGTTVGEGNLHVGPLHAWEEPVRRLIDHPKITPYLLELIGPKFRFDHGYAIFMQRGGAKHPLHGGGTPYDPGQYYHVRNGKLYNGLTVVSFALGDVRPGDGGFAAIPGSHKSNFPCPAGIRQFERTGPWLQQVPQRAGSAIIFTEALTHGTWPWTADTERRSLLYKFAPGHMAWSGRYPAADDAAGADWSPRERRILEPPYIGRRATVLDAEPKRQEENAPQMRGGMT
jgi:ectoine hydroxylase-related dioxygenase (phytanoyl-CoA dioxygenase family)